MKSIRRRTVLGAVAGTLPLLNPAWAQPAYPSRTVKWIVPYQAGGPADLIARIITPKLAELWGQSVVIDNKPGGYTIIAASEATRAQPDGYTLMQAIDATLVMNPAMFKKLPYDPLKDFTHISMLVAFPLVLIANQQTTVKSVSELVALAKAQPGKISCGFSTHASQILVDRFCRALNIEMISVPYKGTADLVKGMLSGEIQTAFDSGAPYASFFESGRVRALATTGPKRSQALPQVPTLTELGIRDIETQIWHGISAPAGLPAAIRDKIQRDISQVLQMPDVISKLSVAGLEARPSTTAEYLKMIQDETSRLGPVIKSLGIQLD